MSRWKICLLVSNLLVLCAAVVLSIPPTNFSSLERSFYVCVPWIAITLSLVFGFTSFSRAILKYVSAVCYLLFALCLLALFLVGFEDDLPGSRVGLLILVPFIVAPVVATLCLFRLPQRDERPGDHTAAR